MITQRANDLIDNAAELEQAALNNVVPVLQGMAWRLSYEIKIVPSVKTASGFMQKGTVQKVVVGYDKKGQPKYKSVYNKFAVMSLFINTEKGTHSKFATIVLGPVDWIQFQKANVNLGQVSANISQRTTAGAVVSMQAKPTEAGAPTGEIVAPAPTQMTPAVTAPKIAPNSVPATGVFQSQNPPLFGNLYKKAGNEILSFNPYPELYTKEETDRLSPDPGKFGGNEQKLKDRGVNTAQIQAVQFLDLSGVGKYPMRAVPFNEFFIYTITPIGTIAPETPKTVALATTLFEYYKAKGETLPSVEERSKLYEQLKLGTANYYTGTYEQNTKLLSSLQGK